VVEVGLQLGRDAEVVHRQADHDGVGGTQLGDQGVGEIDHRLLFGAAFFGLGKKGHEAGAVQVGHRVGGQVALDDTAARVAGLPGGGKTFGELAGLAVGGEQAGVDLEKGVHFRLRVGLGWLY
jgi:hypothetical protein